MEKTQFASRAATPLLIQLFSFLRSHHPITRETFFLQFSVPFLDAKDRMTDPVRLAEPLCNPDGDLRLLSLCLCVSVVNLFSGDLSGIAFARVSCNNKFVILNSSARTCR